MTRAGGSGRAVPAVLRSHHDLVTRGLAEAPVADVPISEDGVTYEMAQVLVWLDGNHFAVGRWDGSMSVFRFNRSSSQGPLMRRAVNSPATQGVQMLAVLPERVVAGSNDVASLACWRSSRPDWMDLREQGRFGYDPAYGMATGGRWVACGHLVVGHSSGFITIWERGGDGREGDGLRMLRAVDLRNPDPVNPWGLHDIHSVEAVGQDRVITGSEDGYVCVVQVPSGRVVSQTVFNPQARRGINSLCYRQGKLLVANCAVGAQDNNLWYYSVDNAGAVVLRDKARLVADQQLPQVFNFAVTFGAYHGGPCWFATTEEGILWMGIAERGLGVIGRRRVTSPLGAALGYEAGQLAVVAYDLYEFTTDAVP